jgi:hypothetical protein
MFEVITLVNSDALRPNQASNLSDAMMNAVARYIAWRQYQIYLHRVANKSLPDGLNSEFQLDDQRLISNIFQGISPQSNRRLYESMISWTVGPVDEGERVESEKLAQPLRRIFDVTKDSWILQLAEEQNRQKALSGNTNIGNTLTDFDAGRINLPTLPNARLSQNKHLVEYHFTKGEFTGKTLAIGFYLEKGYPVYKVLNNDLPATHMSNLISVLRLYNFAPASF